MSLMRKFISVFYKYEGRARGADMPIHHHVKNLVATSSRPNSEALLVRAVLAHIRATFYSCTCELCGGADVVAAVLIDYDDVMVATGMTTRRRRS
jgi:hypothetical protein